MNTETGNDLKESPGNMLSEKKSTPKGYIQYDSTYITFLKQKNYKKGK